MVGAGEVGSYVAALLSREGNDVVVVDERREPLTRIERDNDVLTVVGDATNPSTLLEAEVNKAEVLVAVTQLSLIHISEPTRPERIANGGVRL